MIYVVYLFEKMIEKGATMNSTTQSRQRKLWARAGLLMIAGVFCVCNNVAFAWRTVGEMDTSTRPKDVPLDYVSTPVGFFSPSCVQRVRQGDKMHAENRSIEAADGTVRKVPVCTKPHYLHDGTRVEQNGSSSSPPERGTSTSQGWIEYADNTQSITVGELNSTWIVPPAPLDTGGGSIGVSLFPGLQQKPTLVSILQPVLDWNDDIPNQWSVSSWNCCVAGTTFASDAVQVNVGDLIQGNIVCANYNPTSGCDTTTYNIFTIDLTANTSSNLFNAASNGDLRWVFGGALEIPAGSVTNCNQYPTGPMAFTNTVYDVNLRQIASTLWNTHLPPTTGQPQCNYSVTATNLGGILPPSIITLIAH